MTSNYAEVIDAIAAINANIDGVKAAYNSENLPSTLTVFPAAMTLLGPDDYGRHGQCEYWIRVYVAPVTNSNPSIAYRNCLALSQAFRDTYKQLPHIADTYIVPNHPTVKAGFGSTGFAYTMKWGEASYYGFQLNLPVVSRSN